MISMIKKKVSAVSIILQWRWLTLIALILCIDIEFKIFLIPCCLEKGAGAVNDFILVLSYSYIAAAIFHCIVNDIPHKRRKKTIEPFLKSQLWRIQDKFRLCKETIIPFSSVCGTEFSRKEFIQKFDEINLYEDCYMSNGKSKLKNLEDLRESIIDISSNILCYREFLNDKHFHFINKVLNSSFITKGINAAPDVAITERIGYDSNQYEVGECIYDLYEYSKKINYETNETI